MSKLNWSVENKVKLICLVGLFLASTYVIAEDEDSRTEKSINRETLSIITDVIVAKDIFYLAGKRNSLLSTRDGRIWDVSLLGEGINFRDIAWNGKVFIAVDSQGNIYRSEDGTVWVLVSSTSTLRWHFGRVVTNGSEFIVFGTHEIRYSDSEGNVWSSTVVDSPDNVLRDITWTNGRYLLLSERGIFESESGVKWHYIGRYPHGSGRIIYGAGKYLVIGATGLVETSQDLLTWKKERSGIVDSDLVDIIWTGKQFFVVGRQGKIIASPDGVQWQLLESGTNAFLHAVATNGQIYMAVGSFPYIDGKSPRDGNPLGTTILVSHDGETWLHVGKNAAQAIWDKKKAESP